MLDYRKCSYKDRLRILRDLEDGSRFFETKAGQRLLTSVQEKMDLEGLTRDAFDLQKKNRWRIQGKSLYDIFSQV
jgi:DNA polymerase III sliding clamp (beta) subunit (PCNA family)